MMESVSIDPFLIKPIILYANTGLRCDLDAFSSGVVCMVLTC